MTSKPWWVQKRVLLSVSAAVSLGTVPAGTVIPIRTRRVLATGTTATLVAIY